MCPIIAERLQTGFRWLLYTLAKLMGDHNAVKKGKVGQRVGRRAAGESTDGILEELAQKSSVAIWKSGWASRSPNHQDS